MQLAKTSVSDWSQQSLAHVVHQHFAPAMANRTPHSIPDTLMTLSKSIRTSDFFMEFNANASCVIYTQKAATLQEYRVQVQQRGHWPLR